MLSYDLSILLGFGMFLALYLRNTDELVKKLYSKIDDLSEKLNNERTEREKLSGSVDTLSSSVDTLSSSVDTLTSSVDTITSSLDSLRAEVWSIRLDVEKLS